MKLTSTGRYISASSNFTMLALVALDIIGVLVIFNVSHRLITGAFAPDLLLTWKLVIVAFVAVIGFFKRLANFWV